ncbi:MAG: 4-alpha-glucanotransferase [Gammaproteobacteria bacterium]|nr:4-alpha-glucanotransferase [Gammaproteobacteria bacterium]
MTETVSPFVKRRAGVLLHITSLPESPGNGDLGPQAYRFVDFIQAAGLSVWQVLPHGPTHEDLSPYQCLSAHAGNPLWISLELLQQQGWLQQTEVAPALSIEDIADYRHQCLVEARKGFEEKSQEEDRNNYEQFLQNTSRWLDDFSLYSALRQEHVGRNWLDWPQLERDRVPDAIQAARSRLSGTINQVKFEQFMFYQQWMALKRYANSRGILMFGDFPVYVAHDSADVWVDRRQFDLDKNGNPNAVAGVPPDYFSDTGQLWGNPQYNWEQMLADDFVWWKQRIHSNLELYDLIRVDHFRGFESYWSIQGNAQSASEGEWRTAPGRVLFESLEKEFGQLPLVAEDLGIITSEVDALRQSARLPGMKVLQFAFDGGPDNPYLPHNHERLSVVYTGTHDNDTTLGWYNGLPGDKKQRIANYLNEPAVPMPWLFINTALSSVCRLAMIPLQDFLELGTDQRMNVPATKEGNWRWRFREGLLTAELAEKIKRLVVLYGRG